MLRRAWTLAILLAACSDATGQSGSGSGRPTGPDTLPFAWPPKVGEAYPDLELVDQTGQLTKLSAFRGRIVLVEPIGMNCTGCIAYVGGHTHGPFEGHHPQKGLASLHEYAKTYGKFDLDDPRVVHVHLLLYSLRMDAPTPDDGKRWAAHFQRDRAKDQVVLVGDARFIGPASHGMIPGIHLLDEAGVLRGDSSGHQPTENMYTALLPRAGELVAKLPMPGTK